MLLRSGRLARVSRIKDALLVVLFLLGCLAAVTDPVLLVWVLIGVAVVTGLSEWGKRFRRRD
jgi:hypothetical protein